MRKAMCAVLVVGLCLGTVSIAAAAEQPAMTKDDVLATIVVPKIAPAIENVKAFVSAVEPSVPVQMLTVQLSNLLQSDGLMGVKQGDPLVLLVLNPKKFGTPDQPVPLAFVVPTTKPEDYFSSVELRLPRGEAKDGIETFTEEKRTIDFQALREAAPEGPPDMEQFQTVKKIQHVMTALPDNRVVYGHSEAVVRGVAALLQKKALAINTAGPKDALVRVDADISQLLATFDQEINGFLQFLPMLAEKAKMAAPAGVSTDVQMKMVKIEVEALLEMLKQFKSFSLEAGANKDRVRLTERVAPVPGSLAEKVLAAQRPMKAGTVMDGLPAGRYVAAMAGNLRGMELLREPVGKLVEKFAASVAGEEDLAAMTKSLKEAMEATITLTEGTFAFAMPAGGEEPGFAFVGFTDYTDGAKAKALLREKMFDPKSAFVQMYEKMGMGFSVSKAADKYSRSTSSSST